MYINKNDIRVKYKTIRENIEYRDEKNQLIFENTINLIKEINPKDVFVYLSFSSEVDTKKIIEYLFEKKINVYVPFIRKKDMFPIKILQNEVMLKNSLGIEQPTFSKNNIANKIDICILPLLAYNNELYRIGYGGGYYDKFLAKNECFKIGLAYSEQVCKNLITETHDEKLNAIVTEEGILHE